MSLPKTAAARVNWVPVSCIPSPESPAKRMVTRSSSWTGTSWPFVLVTGPRDPPGSRTRRTGGIGAALAGPASVPQEPTGVRERRRHGDAKAAPGTAGAAPSAGRETAAPGRPATAPAFARLATMDRRRWLGVALAVASACGYGSGALFAKSVYGSGIDWLALLYWRFLIGGLLVWAWALLVPGEPRRAPRPVRGGASSRSSASGAFFVGNAEHVLRRPGVRVGVAGRAHRLHLPGTRRRALDPLGQRPPRSASLGRPRPQHLRRRADDRGDPDEGRADRDRPDRRLADHLLGLHHPGRPPGRRATRRDGGLAHRRRGRRDAARRSPPR